MRCIHVPITYNQIGLLHLPSQVYVVPPANLSFLPSRVETVTGSFLSLPVQVQGYTDEERKSLLPFSDCRKLKVDVSMTDVSIFNVSVESDMGMWCTVSTACVIANFLFIDCWMMCVCVGGGGATSASVGWPFRHGS